MPDANQYALFLLTVYEQVPEGEGGTIKGVGSRVHREPKKEKIRTALDRLAARGLIEATQERRGNVFRWRYQIKGPRLEADAVIERLTAGRGKRRVGRKPGGRNANPPAGPTTIMKVSPWYVDRHGNRSRRVTAVDAAKDLVLSSAKGGLTVAEV